MRRMINNRMTVIHAPAVSLLRTIMFSLKEERPFPKVSSLPNFSKSDNIEGKLSKLFGMR